jgi:hypothetical protein
VPRTPRTELLHPALATGRRSQGFRAAWSGFLVELRGCEDEPDPLDPPVAIFGVTARSGHVLSRLGVLNFRMAQLRGPHSPYLGYLRFTVLREGLRLQVGIAVHGAVAIADQLADAAGLPVGSASPEPEPRPRPPAKRRADSTKKP